MKRYDLMQVTSAYQTDHQMESSDDGEWVRYDDVEADVARLRAAAPSPVTPTPETAEMIATKIVSSCSGKDLHRNIVESLLAFPQVTATVRMLASPSAPALTAPPTALVELYCPICDERMGFDTVDVTRRQPIYECRSGCATRVRIGALSWMDTLHPALPAPPDVTWQPIETAPKDGTEMLIAVNGSVDIGNWQEEKPDSTESGVVVDPGLPAGWYGYLGLCPWDKPQPTHWMPLPAPPKATEEDLTRRDSLPSLDTPQPASTDTKGSER